MRRHRLLSCCVLATLAIAACSERGEDAATGPSARNNNAPVAASTTCISVDSIESLIRAVFPAGNDRSSALSRFNQVTRQVPRSLSTAQNHAMQLVDFLLNKYHDGRMIGGQSVATRQRLEELINGIFCLVGLPPLLPGVLDPDGAAAVVTPTSPTMTIVTGTEWAGVQIPSGGVPTTTLITIRRLPNTPHPLLTQLDQYPLFYEFDYNPGVTFTVPVLVATCLANGETPPDPSRLRLAHNVAPYTMGSIEILPLESAPFLECSDAGELASSGFSRFDLARGGLLLKNTLGKLLLPAPLHAAPMAGSGVGGTVRTFSPFGLVDTLAYMVKVGDRPQATWFGDVVDVHPTVQLTTPTGRPMAGVPVAFVVSQGGGSVTNGQTVTDAMGVATSGQWRLGFQVANQVTATATMPAGAGLITNPLLYSATGLQQ